MAAIAGTKAGTGYVPIEPDFSRFQEKVGKQLNQALAPVMQKAGGRAGKDLARGIDRGGFGQMLRQRFARIGDDAGKELAAKVSKGAKRAEGDMFGLADAVRQVERNQRKASRASKALGGDMFGIGRAAKEAGRGLTFSNSRASDWTRRADGATASSKRLGDRIKGLGYEFGSLSRGIRTSSGGFSGFDGVMARVNRSTQFFRNILRAIKWPVFIAGIGLSLQGLSALAAGAVAAASALGSLSGVLVALPAAALAGAQAFGAFKLATSGVADAVKAALDVETSGGQQAVDVLRRQRDATERVADAKRNLIDVQGQAEKAQDDLREARESATRQLQDMRRAAEGTGTSEKEAALSLREARKELARTLADPASSGLDVQGAELAVERAREDLTTTRVEAKRTREDYKDAQKKGVEGMPEVVAAKEAEADANRAVTDAQRDLRRATEDATAAMENQGSAASALQEKMAQLPPAGQKFARFLISLKPRLDSLRATAAKGLLPGAEKGIKGALRNFGVFRGLIDGTSKSLGRLAAKAGDRLGSAVWGQDLSRLGKLNTRIIDRMGDAGLNLADALRHVLVAAEPFLDWLSESTLELSRWVKGEAAAGRETGRLGAFFDRTRQTMERLGPIFKGVGGALLNISDAADSLGNEILDSLGSAAEGWRKWTDSTKGQNRLKAYFTETRPAVFEMGRLIRDLGKAFFELGKQDGVAELLRLVRTELVPAMRDLVGATTGWAAQFLEDFGRLRKEGVPAFDAFVQVLVEHAGEAGVRIAKAVGRAFLNAGIWGKLAITGFLVSKLGGFRAFGKWGAEAGGRLGQRLFRSAAKWIAGTAAGENLLGWFQGTFSKDGRFGKAASVGGRNVGKLLGRGVVIGMIAGFALYRDDIETAIDKHIIDPIKGKLEDLPGPLGAVADALEAAYDNRELFDPANLGPVPTALGIDVKGFVKDRYSDVFDIPAPDTAKAEQGFDRFRKHVGRQAELTRTAFRTQFDLLPGVAERSAKGALRQMLPRLDALKVQGGNKGDAFAGRMGHSFGSLAKAAKTAFDNIGFNVREMLRVLGGKAPKFDVNKALKEMPELTPLPSKQQGGQVRAARRKTGGLAAMVPGTSTGDRHVLSLNGRPVAKVESKEGIFVGNRNLMGALHQANAEVPRFQKGGQLGAEPQIAGPAGSLRSIGQLAIKKVYEGAEDFVANARPKISGIVGSVDLSGISGSVASQAAEIARRARSPFRSTLALFEALWAESSMGEASPGNVLQALEPYTKIRPAAQEISGFLTGHPTWTGTAAIPLARSTSLPAHAIAQLVQKSGVGEGNEGRANYLKAKGLALGTMSKFGLVPRGLAGMKSGGMLRKAIGGDSFAALDGRNSRFAEALRRSSGAMKGTAARAVAWAKNNLGTREGSAKQQAWGPDPWCGYFFGAALRAQGVPLPPNPGYTPSYEDEWGNGSSNAGGISGAAPGDFLGYSGDHTAMYIGGGRAISGNYGDAVTEHGVGDPSSRLTSVRHPNYPGGSGGTTGTAGGTVHGPPKEKIPATYRGAKTGALDLGPKPQTVKETEKQIAKWQKQAPVYRKAKRHAEKHGKPGTAQAIGQNLTKIEERLSALRSLRTQLRLKEVRKRLNKRFSKAFGRFGNYEQIIEGSQLAYEKAEQDAEQLVALEPQSPELPANATDAQREAAEKAYVAQFSNYVDTRERPAYQTVLETVASWRNNILRAERFGFGKGNPSVAASENAWEGETRGVRARIEKIQRFSEQVEERVKKFKSEHKGEPLPDGLKKQVAERDAMRKELPILKLRDTRLSDAVLKARELFFPGGENRLAELPMGKRVQIPLPGSGSLEEKLREVQGIHWPDSHELLSAGEIGGTRIAGRFGGAIWNVQETIEGLGLKIKEAMNGVGSGSGEGDGGGERESLLRELLTQANQEKILRGIEERILGGRESFFPPYAGKAHSGAIVPGPRTQERTMIVKGREGIFTEEQMAALGAGSVVVPQGDLQLSVVIYEDGTAEAKLGEKAVEAIIERRDRRQARNAGRRRAGRPF